MPGTVTAAPCSGCPHDRAMHYRTPGGLIGGCITGGCTCSSYGSTPVPASPAALVDEVAARLLDLAAEQLDKEAQQP